MVRIPQSRGSPEDVHLAVFMWRGKETQTIFLPKLLVLPTLAALLWTEDRINKLGKKQDYTSLINWQHIPWTDHTFQKSNILIVDKSQNQKSYLPHFSSPREQKQTNQTTIGSLSTQLLQLVRLLLQSMGFLLFLEIYQSRLQCKWSLNRRTNKRIGGVCPVYQIHTLKLEGKKKPTQNQNTNHPKPNKNPHHSCSVPSWIHHNYGQNC